ncbi:MAG: hypothetical protein AB7N11_37605 [Mycolicibacterium sp.]
MNSSSMATWPYNTEKPPPLPTRRNCIPAALFRVLACWNAISAGVVGAVVDRRLVGQRGGVHDLGVLAGEIDPGG